VEETADVEGALALGADDDVEGLFDLPVPEKSPVFAHTGAYSFSSLEAATTF
jgi:hypothetical protein